MGKIKRTSKTKAFVNKHRFESPFAAKVQEDESV